MAFDEVMRNSEFQIKVSCASLLNSIRTGINILGFEY